MDTIKKKWLIYLTQDRYRLNKIIWLIKYVQELERAGYEVEVHGKKSPKKYNKLKGGNV